jgi:hypothetical protein
MLLLLFVIGGGRAGGSFRVVPRTRRSKIEIKQFVECLKDVQDTI